ncbi:MAG: glycosyltransferase, partial [Bryobacteraceae bacterium]
MKFSVLLPTRNRLELLRLAVESVLIQDHSDWEILISDNASDSNIAAEMTKLGDARIKVRRSNRLVAVTENWNESLSMASGEYVIMLGDDDALVPGALSKLQILLEEWAYPDAIYAQARQYAYANVVPGHPAAFMQTGYNAFLEGSTQPFRMSRDIARKMVRGALAFRILYGFNMQHFVFSRRLVERLQPKGPFFQSPYPDYYAANAILLASDTLVVTPDCISLIGISPKSFGFYYVNS